jgi:uncharacterized repeat protein (TIGR03803 family)
MNKRYTAICLPILIFLFSLNSKAQVFWGMTSTGGASNFGTIFKTDTAGMNLSVRYSFLCTEPGALIYGDMVQAANGKYYGLTSFGQAAGGGILFEYDPATSAYTNKLEFTGTVNGANPRGSLIRATNNLLYGLTTNGGANNLGVMFEYNAATNTYTKIYDFGGAADGSHPNGALVQTSTGKLYGMTSDGGLHNAGVIFEYDLSTATFTKRINLDTLSSGAYPNGSLVEGKNGKLYGMTSIGGTSGLGVLLEYDTATATCTKKLNFSGAVNGSNPMGSMIRSTTGKLYGMTSTGGLHNLGVLFEYNTATSTFTNKLDFAGITNGSNPNGSLTEAVSGKLYGMTTNGGSAGNGIIFEYDTLSAIATNKLNFTGDKGGNPNGSLIQGANGKLYGATTFGGLNRDGVVFEFDPLTLTYTDKIDLNGALNGGIPAGSLMLASNGLLYGMTSTGGTGGIGVIFSFDTTTSTYTKLVDFNGAGNGFSPHGSFIQASNGKLYGVATGGGTKNDGTLFEYDPATSTFVKRMDFDSVATGLSPQGTLFQASNGKLYGMTYQGGTSNNGVLFEYDLNTSTFTKKADFDGPVLGANPQGALIQTAAGTMYGLTASGGSAGTGTIFKFSPATGICTKLIDLTGPNGASPYGSLLEGANGILYGLTSGGGALGNGVLFDFDTAAVNETVRYSFNSGIGGEAPQGSLVFGPNGKMFGTAVNGGTTGDGKIFEYIPSSFSTSGKQNLNAATTGNYPYGDLIFLCNPVSVTLQPADTSKCEGSSVQFKLTAKGGSTISYQWYDNGTLIPGVTTNPGTLTALNLGETGPVYCQVMNGCSSINSNTANLIVNPLPSTPTITQNITSLVSSAAAGNQWYLNGTIIPGETGQNYVVTQNGNYTVVVTNGNGCSSSSLPYNFSDTGIQSGTANGMIHIAPNPADAVLTVTLPSGTGANARLSILDMLGNVVLDNQETLSNPVLVNIATLPEGMYILKVSGKDVQSLMRFIKR